MAALHTSEAMFEQALRFNVTSAFLLTRLAVPHMLASAGGGSIVNISSAAGRLVMAGFVAYGTAKAALSFMTRELGREFAPKVRVNAIAVGAVETSALAPFLDDELRGKMEALTPMRRIGTVEDIALAALYLASPAVELGDRQGVRGRRRHRSDQLAVRGADDLTPAIRRAPGCRARCSGGRQPATPGAPQKQRPPRGKPGVS